MIFNVPNYKLTHFFILFLMKKGNKRVAKMLMLKLVKNLRKDHKKEPLLVFIQALENTTPLIGFRKVKLRGSSYNIPYFLKIPELHEI